jgi:putative ABC transport system substrate-binding protein
MALGTSSMHPGSGTWPAKLRSLALLLAIVCMSATERVADAQTAARIPVIGYLQERAGPTEFDQAFLRGLNELGYVEGKNFAIEYRWAEGKPERLPTLAADLVRLKVDVIVTALFPATKAARDATSTIPIVMATSIDAVGEGLVASFARPGGNITGLALFSRDLIGKRLEICQEVVPGLQRVGALFNEGNPANPPQVSDVKDAAAQLGIKAVPLAVRFPDGIEPAFAEAERERIGAVIIISDTTTITNRSQLGAAALKHHIPTIFANRAYLQGGGLMSYGPNLPDRYRRAASYVDRILKGAKPADMPIEQPTKLELVINLKAGRALGLVIPQSMLLRADDVIE